ncbi:MAG: AEC family transporter [Pseudomonadota bacterium]
MLAIFLKTLPFFALIALGYGAARARFFPEEATASLTKFVFYFALSAMLFRFSANLSLSDIFDGAYIMAYFCAAAFVYLIATTVAFLRGVNVAEAAVEAQTAVVGNVGFLGIPMFVLLLGERSIGPAMLALAVDLLFFGSLIVIVITGSRDGRMSLGALRAVGMGLLKNPMIVSIGSGFVWSGAGLPIPAAMNEFLSLLGGAATPAALFAIGASLAGKSAERLSTAIWLSALKLTLHPAVVAILAFVVFPIDSYAAGVMVATAALPVAGNVYIIAQHYGVAPQRASTSILVSTVFSIFTFSGVIALLNHFEVFGTL